MELNLSFCKLFPFAAGWKIWAIYRLSLKFFFYLPKNGIWNLSPCYKICLCDLL